MIGVYLGVATAAILALLALRKPILARIGTSQALRRPKQTVLVIAGLMFGTIVLGASAISADSTRESFKTALVRDQAANDLVGFDVRSSFMLSSSLFGEPSNQTTVDGFRARMGPDVVAATAALYVDAPVENAANGLGGEHTLLGVDPATWAQVMGWEAQDGDPPSSLASWPTGTVLLDHRLADRLDARVGDTVTAYLQGSEFTREHNQTFRGRLELSATNPLTFDQVESPTNVQDFTYAGPDEAATPVRGHVFVAYDGTSPQRPMLTGYVETAWGAVPLEPTVAGYAEAVLYGDQASLPWTLHVQSQQAVAADFDVVASLQYRVEGVLSVVEGRVGAILSKGGHAGGWGAGPAVVVPLPTLQDAIGQPAVNFAAFDLAEGASARRHEQALSGTESWVFDSPREDLQRDLADIDLATRGFFLGMGSFTMIAGIMLVFVLLALLVEERRAQLGTMRAVGGQRADLTRLYAHEGAVYAILAAIAGVLFAALLAALLARETRRLLDAEDIPFALHVQPLTLLTVIGLGFMLTVLVFVIAAWRAVRIHVPSALRGEDAPRRQRRILLPLLSSLIGLLTTLAGFAVVSPTLMVLGPCLLCFGAAALLGRWMNPKLAIAAGSFAAAVYLAATFAFIDVVDEETAILVPVRGVLLVIAAAILAAYSRAVHGLVVRASRIMPGAAPVAEYGLAHLRERPARAALTLAMLATVLSVMTALGTIFSTVAPQDLGATGGFSVLAQFETPLTDARAAYDASPPRSGVDPFPLMERHFMVPHAPYQSDFSRPSDGAEVTLDSWSQFTGTVGVTEEAAQAWDYRATALDDRYGSMREALLAVARDPSLAVVSDAVHYELYDDDLEPSGPTTVRVGDRLLARGGDETDPNAFVTIIGKVRDLGSAAVLVHASRIEDGTGSRLYADPAPGVRSGELRTALAAGFRPYAAEAVVVNDIDRESQYVFRAIQALVALFLGLGIAVGMVSLGLISVRNVVVRRAEIGVLRATGARRRQILAMLALENLYVTLGAIAIGLGVGLLLAYNVLTIDDFVTFSIDWVGLALLYGITLVGAALAALVPAWQASRIPPAQAVRHSE